jgi:hypothetical protein
MLHSSSIIKNIHYASNRISYSTFDDTSDQTFRLTTKPTAIKVNGTRLQQATSATSRGWTWRTLQIGGILRIKIMKGNQVEILK